MTSRRTRQSCRAVLALGLLLLSAVLWARHSGPAHPNAPEALRPRDASAGAVPAQAEYAATPAAEVPFTTEPHDERAAPPPAGDLVSGPCTAGGEAPPVRPRVATLPFVAGATSPRAPPAA